MVDLKEVWDFITLHPKFFSVLLGSPALLGLFSLLKRWMTLHYAHKGELLKHQEALLKHEEAKINAEKEIKIEKIRAKSNQNSSNDIPNLRIDRESP